MRAVGVAMLGVWLGLGATGCEAIRAMIGMAEAAKEIGEYLEEDLKSELTDAKITKALEVTPKLIEFSKTAEHKWELDPNAPDFSKLASAMGAMSDYIAFFEDNDTRLTEYYVDMVKIADARALITLRKAHEEAMAKEEAERKKLQADLDAATDDAKKAEIQKELDRNAKATKQLQDSYAEGQKAREQMRNQPGNAYSLSDEEIARVEARLDEVTKVLDAKNE